MAAKFCFESMVEHAGRNHRAWVIDKGGSGSERKLSYSDLVGHARALATHLKASGVEPREIIGLKSPNRLEWLVWELAAIMCNVVLQVFPEDQSGADRERVEQYRLRLLISETAAAEGASDGIFDISSTLRLSDIALAGGDAPLAPHSDLHSKTFSSGTAGSLKGLMISRRGTELMVNQFIDAFGIADNDSTILFLPFSHYPQRLTLYASLWAGASLCLADVDEVAMCAQTVRPTFLSSQASFFDEAIRNGSSPDTEEAQEVLGGKLRFILTAMASREMLERYADIAVPVYETYGITELGMVAWNHPNNTRYGTVGKPLDPSEVMFADDGEILVKRESSLCIGYYSGLDEESMFEPGYFHTEDLGELDDEGFLVLKGRKKNAVKTKSGERYQLEAIEVRIQDLSGVEFAAVLYDEANDAMVCYVVPYEGQSRPAEAALRQSVISLLSTEVAKISSKRLVFGREKPSMKNGTMTRSMKLDRAGMLGWLKGLDADRWPPFGRLRPVVSSHRLLGGVSEPRLITDPGLLEELEGYSYVVLRPHGEILERFVEIKRALQCTAAAGRYVDAPHITLLQVAPGHDINELKQAVARWASARTPFEVVARNAAATLFGLPLVTVGVEPSGPLTDALATVREMADSVSLPYRRDIAVADWVFHITLLDYAAAVPDEARAVAGLLAEYEEFSSACTVAQAHLVSYRSGTEESAGIFDFVS